MSEGGLTRPSAVETGKVKLVYSRREQEILEVAQAVFSDRGFHGADVEEIARQAGVGKGTIYRHFGNKEALFLHLIRWGFRGLLRDLRVQEEKESDPLRRLQAFIQGYLRFFDRNGGLFQILAHESQRFQMERGEECWDLHQSVIEHLVRIIETGREQGIRWRIPPELGAIALLGALNALIYSRIQGGQAEITTLGGVVEGLFLHGALLEVGPEAEVGRG